MIRGLDAASIPATMQGKQEWTDVSGNYTPWPESMGICPVTPGRPFKLAQKI